MLSRSGILVTEYITGLNVMFTYVSFHKYNGHSLEQHCVTELSEMMEMFFVQYTSQKL